MRKVILASTIALLGLTSTAHAHFGLQSPPQVVAQTDVSGKGSPPCGPDTGMAATPTPVQGGHPLTIKVFESVGHFGFYRVALALQSRSELPVDNVVYDASGKVLPPNGMPTGTSARADVENPAVFPVLADNLFKHTTAPNMVTYMGDVMIPNVTCDRCILQVIEFMYPHGFNTSVPGPGGGYFYHHCAELKITADPSLPPFMAGADGGAGGTSGKDAAAEASTTGTGGTTGTAGSGSAGTGGNNGTSGASGTTGAAGTGTGTAGVSGTGASGSNGAAGTTATGTAGATSGSAGTTAGTGPRQGGGGGCNISGRNELGLWCLASLGAVVFAASRRRRRP
jgi:hypothetical protein